MLPAQELSIEYDAIGSIKVVGACRLPTVIDQALPGNAFEAAEGKSSQMLLRRHADISQSDDNFLDSTAYAQSDAEQVADAEIVAGSATGSV